MKQAVKVDVGGKRGYKLRTKTDHRDFVSIIREYVIEDDGVTFLTETYLNNEAAVKISFASESIYRVKMFPFCRTDIRQNPVFDFPALKEFQVHEDELFIYINTLRLELSIRKCPWEISVKLDGRPLTGEHIKDFNVDQRYKAMPLGFEYDVDTKEVRKAYETYYMHVDEGFYGFGEKFTEFNKRGQVVEIWQKDALSTNSDASYKGMPYFMSSYGYAVRLNTFTRTSFDMGAYSEVSYTMFSEDAYLDYYVFCNRSYKGLIRDYTLKSGRSAMIPKWSFGFWMSKMSYMTREEVEGVVSRAEEFGMSMDVIHIDDWQSSKSTDLLSFDEERYPNPKEMIAGLNQKGVQLSCWMFPYVEKYCREDKKTVRPVYARLSELGYLVKDSEGGICEFIPIEGDEDGDGAIMAAVDFTNPEAAEYVKGRIRKLMELGVGVMKTDFSEEIPENAVFFDGTTGKESHNKYPLLYAKTIYEASGEVKEKAGKKALLWGRSGYAGSQNYPANWAGDSSTHKNNLAAVLRGGLSVGISGVSFWGFDIGGFYNCDYEGNRVKPDDEEYIRSAQMGMLVPLSRSHGQATPREPWEYSGEVQEAFLKINKFRYRLLPYLYSLAAETHREGIPMMRAMLLEFQEDLNTRELSTQYMLGNALLVAPVFDQQVQHVYLPAGNWVDWNTGKRVEGGRWVAQDCALDRLPLYFREDTILPVLNEAKMHTPDYFFEDYTVHMNLVHEVSASLYDEEKEYTLHAGIKDDKIIVDTDMTCTGLCINTLADVAAVVVNGREYYVNKENGRYAVIFSCRS